MDPVLLILAQALGIPPQQLQAAVAAHQQTAGRPGADLTNEQNTPLTPEEEARFQQWRAGLPEDLQNMRDYDLRGAWKADAQAAANGHLPDTWKKRNHMTISDESIHAGPNSGHWSDKAPDGTYTYTAPADFTRYHTPDQELNYFQAVENNGQRQPDGSMRYPLPANRVVLPRGTQ